MNMNPKGKSFNIDAEWISWQDYFDNSLAKNWTDIDWQEEFGFTQKEAIELTGDNTEALALELRKAYPEDLYKIDMESLDTITLTEWGDSFPLAIIHSGLINGYPVYKVDYPWTIEEPEYYDLTAMSNDEIAAEIFSYISIQNWQRLRK